MDDSRSRSEQSHPSHSNGFWAFVRRVGRLEAELAFLGTTLATYLGIVHIFSFSQDSASARQSINLAILLMDGVLLVCILKAPSSLVSKREVPLGVRRYLQLLSWLLLVSVVLLHCDYLLTRYRGGEYGLAGGLSDIKAYLLLCQLSGMLAAAVAMSSSSKLRVDRLDILVSSLVLVPLANYLVRNRNDFTLLAAVEFIALFVTLPVMGLWFLQLIQRGLGARANAVALVVGLTFAHYSMPMVSAALERPIEALFFIQLALVAAMSGALAALYTADKAALAKAISAFTGVSLAASVVMAAYVGAESPRSGAAMSPSGVAQPLTPEYLSAPARRTPDVYLLVYDGYAAPSMLRRFGIDNDDQLAYFARNRFVVYEQAYSLHLSSLGSMSAVMNMGAISQVGIGGATTATQFFKNHGYRTNLILNAHLLKGPEVMVDFTFPPATYRSGLNALYRGIGGGEFKAETVFQDSTRDEWVSAKRATISIDHPEPRMVYAHSGYPGHSQNSGRCLDDEVSRYSDRLAIANREIKDDVETILRTGRDAVIILAGDHGPYLTGDCLYLSGYETEELTAEHLADRYGTMLAIRWPDDAYKKFDRISTIQDVFVAVSAFLLDDGSVLQHKPPSVTSGYGGIPDGAVRDGIVTIGSDSGMPLLPASEQPLRAPTAVEGPS